MPVNPAKLGLLVLALCVGPAHAEFVARYAEPESAKYRHVSADFQQRKLLETLARYLNDAVQVPGVVSLVFTECGQSNAYYRPSTRSVVMCYELMEEVAGKVLQDFRSSSFEAVSDVTFGTVMFFLFHEVGHALVDVLMLPILAREEDSADAIATYFQLNSAMRFPSVIGAAWFFDSMSASLTNQQFSDEHSFGPQRKFNVLCFAFGSDPTAFSKMAQSAGLSVERANRCGDEYARLDSSVRKLLGRNLRR